MKSSAQRLYCIFSHKTGITWGEHYMQEILIPTDLETGSRVAIIVLTAVALGAVALNTAKFPDLWPDLWPNPWPDNTALDTALNPEYSLRLSMWGPAVAGHRM